VGTAGPSGAGQGDKRSAEDARKYARRLRSLPVDQVLGDFLFSLLHAAQVKLGRRDARLPINVTAVAHEHARPYLPGELTRQIGPVLGQLRPGRRARKATRASNASHRRTIWAGPGRAAGRCSAVTPPARRAAW